MAKPTLMIHGFKREYLDLPLRDYTLTFDDGLASPLQYWKDIKVIPTEKIFFIPTSAIQLYTGKEGDVGIENKPYWEFMTLEMVKFLDGYDDVTIGGHSHYHKRLNSFNRFVEAVEFLNDDTEIMCHWFEDHLGYRPTHFCYPYNETNGVYESIVKIQFNIPHIYGAERIDIEELL